MYVSNSGIIHNSSLCYKENGLQLPSLNFTITCAETGRYVIFYNARLDGVKYPTGYELQNVLTELCEVIVKGKFKFLKKYYHKTCITAVKNNLDVSTI